MKDILVPISPGELLDKITILRIKQARILDPGKLANVKLELALLEQTWRDRGGGSHDLARDERALEDVRSEEHTSELQSRLHLVCRLLLEKKNTSATARAGNAASCRPTCL